jgi:hypothetical protein
MESNKSRLDKDFLCKKIDKYIFFDGVNHFNVQQTYDNWLTTSDFNFYKNSFIEIDNLKIYLFNAPSIDALITFHERYSLEDLELMSIHFGLTVKKGINSCVIIEKKHPFDNFFLIKSFTASKKYIVIYGIGGSRFPESIYIHGVWDIDYIPNWL